MRGGTFGVRAHARQRLGFGVRPPAGLGPTARNDVAVFDDNASDSGIGPDGAEPARGQRQGPPHEFGRVVGGRLHMNTRRHGRA